MHTYSERYADLLKYIRENWIKSFHEPEGALKYRFIDPASSSTGGSFGTGIPSSVPGL